MAKDIICVGVITGSFGVRGEARVKSFCADPTAIGDYGPLKSEDGAQEFTLTITGPVKGGFAARLGGSRSKEQVDQLKGTRLYAKRDVLPSLPDDEYYYTDLIGLPVFDTGGVKLGRVQAVQNFGSGDLLEIVGPYISGSAFLPFTSEAVPTVDIGAKRIVADPPEGIFAGGEDD